MSDKKISVVFFGSPQLSADILEALLVELSEAPTRPQKRPDDSQAESQTTSFEVRAVITNPDRPVGRQKILKSTPVSDVAQRYKIPTLKPEKLTDEFLTENKNLLTADLFIVAAYGKIIPGSLLEIPPLGAINWHPSLLPKYRGASPIQAAILNGDKTTGVIIMLMDEKMDHGPILATTKLEISDQDNYLTLSKKLIEVGSKLLIETLAKFVSGKITPKPQNHDKATYTWKISETKQTAFFDVYNPPIPEVIDRMSRTFYPEPGCWTLWNNKTVKFLPGKLVQMEGKKPLSLKEFLNGYPDFPIRSLL